MRVLRGRGRFGFSCGLEKGAACECREALECGGLTPLFLSGGTRGSSCNLRAESWAPRRAFLTHFVRATTVGRSGLHGSGAGDSACGSLFRRLAGTSGESPAETRQASRLPHCRSPEPEKAFVILSAEKPKRRQAGALQSLAPHSITSRGHHAMMSFTTRPYTSVSR